MLTVTPPSWLTDMHTNTHTHICPSSAPLLTENMPRQPCRCKSSADRHIVGVRAEISPFPSLVWKKKHWISFNILLMLISNSLICTKLSLCACVCVRVSLLRLTPRCQWGVVDVRFSFEQKVSQNSLCYGSEWRKAFRDFLFFIYSFPFTFLADALIWCDIKCAQL